MGVYRAPRKFPMRVTHSSYNDGPRAEVVQWTAGHAARIHQIESDVRPNGSVYSVSDLRRLCASAGSCGRVARFDGQVVGYALFTILPSAVELHRIGVDPGWQGQGIGRRLVDVIVSEFLDWNRPRLFLDLMESAVAAHEAWALRACRRLAGMGFRPAVAATKNGPAWRFTRRFEPLAA